MILISHNSRMSWPRSDISLPATRCITACSSRLLSASFVGRNTILRALVLSHTVKWCSLTSVASSVRLLGFHICEPSTTLQTPRTFLPLVSELDLRCLTLLAPCSMKACISAPSLSELPFELTLAVELVLRCFVASTCGDISPLIQWKSEYTISKVRVDDILHSQDYQNFERILAVLLWSCC